MVKKCTKFGNFIYFRRFCGKHFDFTPIKMGSNNDSPESDVSPVRYYGVTGFEDRKNDVVYGPPLKKSDDDVSTVVFFPGDVQDFTENMEAHRDNKYHKQWNLESTATKLQNKFHDCHVIVVKPSRMDYKTFSCFENFVKSSQLGVPEHTPNYNGLRHLEHLVKNVSEKIGEESVEDNTKVIKDVPSKLENSNLKLVGFSKGCVVLNQFLYEFHNNTVKSDQEITNIISKIKDMYWLDGGHSGGKNTWITDKTILGALKSLDINFHVHVTPYQIRDERRPWIKKEEKAFSEYLTKLGCKVERTVHFEALPPSIITHFDVINAFSK